MSTEIFLKAEELRQLRDGFVPRFRIFLHHIVDAFVPYQVLPDRLRRLHEIVVQRKFLLDERAAVRQVHVVVDQRQFALLIQVGR